MIQAVDGIPFKLARGKVQFNTGGTGDITLAITLKDGTASSTTILTAPYSYIDEVADCTIVPTLGTAALDLDYIEIY